MLTLPTGAPQASPGNKIRLRATADEGVALEGDFVAARASGAWLAVVWRRIRDSSSRRARACRLYRKRPRWVQSHRVVDDAELGQFFRVVENLLSPVDPVLRDPFVALLVCDLVTRLVLGHSG